MTFVNDFKPFDRRCVKPDEEVVHQVRRVNIGSSRDDADVAVRSRKSDFAIPPSNAQEKPSEVKKVLEVVERSGEMALNPGV